MDVWSHIQYNSKSMDQPGKVANAITRGQLNRENGYFPVPVPV